MNKNDKIYSLRFRDVGEIEEVKNNKEYVIRINETLHTVEESEILSMEQCRDILTNKELQKWAAIL